jgi:hypothetical protein
VGKFKSKQASKRTLGRDAQNKKLAVTDWKWLSRCCVLLSRRRPKMQDAPEAVTTRIPSKQFLANQGLRPLTSALSSHININKTHHPKA